MSNIGLGDCCKLIDILARGEIRSVHIFDSKSSSFSKHVHTTPDIVASITAERSFSRLKLIKSYLRSTMTENRLSDLGL